METELYIGLDVHLDLFANTNRNSAEIMRTGASSFAILLAISEAKLQH